MRGDLVEQLGGRESSQNGQGDLAELASFAASVDLWSVGPDAKEAVKLLLLDTIGVMISGSVGREVGALRPRLSTGDGLCTFVGARLRAGPVAAALVNSTEAVWHDFDAPHRHPRGLPLLPAVHMAAHVVPGALALAEMLGKSGKDLLLAILVGYEIGARISVACRPWPNLHPHGSIPSIGVAAAAGRLFDDRPELLGRRIRTAASLVWMPSFENAYQGRTMRNVAAGIGTATGILAAKLALLGFTSSDHVFRSVFGGILSEGIDSAGLVDGLGQQYEIEHVSFKLYPCARYLHPAIEAAHKIVQSHRVRPDAIREIKVATYGLAQKRDNGLAAPKNGLEAKFSIPYVVATMLVRGHVGVDQFTEDALADPIVRKVAMRVVVEEDEDFTRKTPVDLPARVTIAMVDGSQLEADVQAAPGALAVQITKAKVIEKFAALVDPILGSRRRATIEHVIEGIDLIPDTRQLMTLLVP